MRTFKGGDKVKGGFYFNRAEWTMRVAPQEGDVLPGGENQQYYAFPAWVLVIAAPLLGFAFAMFLPFIGLAMLVKAGVDKGAVAWHEAKTAEKPVVRVTK